jgi:chemotaxis protein histidine kinase CheA
VESLAIHCQAEAWKKFELAAHSLKGTAKTVGALILGNQALQLELWVQNGHTGNRDGEIEVAEKEYQAVIKELARYRDGLKNNQRQFS